MIQKTYLPFTANQVRKYFSKNQVNNVKYYINSAQNYNNWLANLSIATSKNYKTIRQIEKDERFWGAQSFITIFEQILEKDISNNIKDLLNTVFKEKPPFSEFKTWDEALTTKGDDKLILRFEENIPSPNAYKKFLKKNILYRNIIPYTIDHAKRKKNLLQFRSDLEGATHVDILIINPSNGFNIFIEAKVLSDISYQVSYDTMRNQIARNIDIMLTDNRGEYKGKSYEDGRKDCRQYLNPDRSIFLLLTPQLFKANPHTRLYGYKMDDYRLNPASLKTDLEHRGEFDDEQWQNITKRIGWVTWEDLNMVNKDSCPWVK